MRNHIASFASDPSGVWSRFLKRLNQYKELFSVIVFFLGGVFWLYAFFATKEQLDEAQCINNLNISMIEAEVKKNFFRDELIEKAAMVQELERKGTLSENEKLLLQRNRDAINTIRRNLHINIDKYNNSFLEIKENKCESKMVAP